jgi:hypothetical protein
LPFARAAGSAVTVPVIGKAGAVIAVITVVGDLAFTTMRDRNRAEGYMAGELFMRADKATGNAWFRIHGQEREVAMVGSENQISASGCMANCLNDNPLFGAGTAMLVFCELFVCRWESWNCQRCRDIANGLMQAAIAWCFLYCSVWS